LIGVASRGDQDVSGDRRSRNANPR